VLSWQELIVHPPPELAEHLVQVVVDGALADVRAGGDLGVGQSLAGQAGDAGLLRGELI
jgi:hypothetical protein